MTSSTNDVPGEVLNLLITGGGEGGAARVGGRGYKLFTVDKSRFSSPRPLNLTTNSPGAPVWR